MRALTPPPLALLPRITSNIQLVRSSTPTLWVGDPYQRRLTNFFCLSSKKSELTHLTLKETTIAANVAIAYQYQHPLSFPTRSQEEPLLPISDSKSESPAALLNSSSDFAIAVPVRACRCFLSLLFLPGT